MMIELDSEISVIREMWNGAWTTLALATILALVVIAADRVRTLRQNGHSWYEDMAIQICLALCVFFSGSGLRAGYIWLLIHCETNTPQSCERLIDKSWLMSVAGFLAIVGSLCVIRVISPRHWQPWPWVLAGLFALGVPLAYYVID